MAEVEERQKMEIKMIKHLIEGRKKKINKDTVDLYACYQQHCNNISSGKPLEAMEKRFISADRRTQHLLDTLALTGSKYYALPGCISKGAMWHV